MSTMPTTPPGLRALVTSYEHRAQQPVRFRPSSWGNALATALPGVTNLLHDDRYTATYEGGPPAQSGDRTTTRAAVSAACNAMNLDDASQVLQVFVLIMA